MMKPAAGEAYLETVLAPVNSLPSFWSTACKQIAKLRCRLIHRSISMPVNGQYRCWTCLQEFETDF